MTLDEAIEVLQQDIPCERDTDLIEALEMAIEALKQQPCEDAISRQAILNEIPVLWNSNGDKDYCMESLRDFVTELPPDRQDCDTCEVGNPCLYCKHEFEPKVPDICVGNMSEIPTGLEEREE